MMRGREVPPEVDADVRKAVRVGHEEIRCRRPLSAG
jgi:hypothetical protein